jgi:hypothetical protein
LRLLAAGRSRGAEDETALSAGVPCRGCPAGAFERVAASRGRAGFHVALHGFRGVSITLRRELVDANTGDELGETSATTITPPSDEIAREWHDWIDLTGRRGRYFVIVKLTAPDEAAPLASLQTRPFAQTS